MLTFRSSKDQEKIPPSDPAYPVIRRLLGRIPEILPRYDPDADGYIVLLQKGDYAGDIPEIGSEGEIQWEGVTRQEGFFHAIYLTNNQFALEIVIPDEDWLSPDLRRSLEDALT